MNISVSFRLIMFFIAVTGLLACNSARKKSRQQIAKLQEAWETTHDPAKADSLVEMYYSYQSAYPDDTLSASYVRRAAVVLESRAYIPEAINALELIIEKYPKYRRISKTYVDLGRLYEIQGDIANAKRIYTEYLEKFPNDVDAANVKFMLDNLGLSPEQIKQNLLNPDTSRAAQ